MDEVLIGESLGEVIERADQSGRLVEVIGGVVVEKMPTEEHGMIIANLVYKLRGYLEAHPIGRLGVEVRHQLPDDLANSYLPDVSLRLTLEAAIKRGAVPAMPDLAVEVLSPDQSLRQLREKARYYLAHGGQMVWIVIPQHQLIEVYTAQDEWIVGRDGMLEVEELLPGFTLAAAYLFSG